MNKKGKPTTMRFDEEVEALIENYKGNNFSEKFHNLVYDFKKSIPDREKKLKELDDEISEKKIELKKLSDKLNKMEWLDQSIGDLKIRIQECIDAAKNCSTQ
jgi:DNA polymerase III epsilon subunit-like protein